MVHQHRHRHVLEAEGERRDRVRQRRIDLQQGAQQHEAVEHLLHRGTGDHDHQAHEDRRPEDQGPDHLLVGVRAGQTQDLHDRRPREGVEGEGQDEGEQDVERGPPPPRPE